MTQKSKTRPAAADSPASRVPTPRWQPRFGLGAMLLVMLVCGVMSSAGYYLVRGSMAQPGQTGESGFRLQLVFLLITLAAPLLLAAAVSVVLQVSRYFTRRKS